MNNLLDMKYERFQKGNFVKIRLNNGNTWMEIVEVNKYESEDLFDLKPINQPQSSVISLPDQNFLGIELDSLHESGKTLIEILGFEKEKEGSFFKGDWSWKVEVQQYKEWQNGIDFIGICSSKKEILNKETGLSVRCIHSLQNFIKDFPILSKDDFDRIIPINQRKPMLPLE